MILIGSTVTLDASAYGAAIQFMSNSAVTATLPAQNSSAGGSILFYHQGAAAATIIPQTNGFIHYTIAGSSINLPSITLQPGDTIELVSRGGSGTEWDVVGGTWAIRYSTVLPVNDTGTANAYAASNAAPLTTATLVQGTRQRVVIKNTNTGPSTYAPDGLGASPIFGLGGGALQGGELVAGGIADLEYTFSAAINAGMQVWMLKSGTPGAMQIPGNSYTPTPDKSDRSDHLATTAFVQQALDSFTILPVGTVLPFAGSAAPAGFLLAAGSLVSRTTYAALFAVIGTTYGAGDGSTTFALPDTRGVVLRGLDNGRGLDSGRALGSYQADSFASHNHGVNDSGHAHSVYDPGHNHSTTITAHPAAAGASKGYFGPAGSTVNANDPWDSSWSATNIGIYASGTGISVQSSGDSETRPKNLAINHIIKY